MERMLRAVRTGSLRGGCAVGEPRAPGGPKCFADLVDEALRGSARHIGSVLPKSPIRGTSPHSECRRWSEETLVVLFDDDDSDVRSEAASCFGTSWRMTSSIRTAI